MSSPCLIRCFRKDWGRLERKQWGESRRDQVFSHCSVGCSDPEPHRASTRRCLIHSVMNILQETGPFLSVSTLPSHQPCISLILPTLQPPMHAVPKSPLSVEGCEGMRGLAGPVIPGLAVTPKAACAREHTQEWSLGSHSDPCRSLSCSPPVAFADQVFFPRMRFSCSQFSACPSLPYNGH